MSDIRDQFDKMLAAMERISLISQLSDKVVEADRVARSECGNCQHWMKSRICPREYNDNGRQRGPSMSGIACEKFVMQQSAIDLQHRRVREAVEFADKYDLPVPSRMRELVGYPKQQEGS